MIFIRILSVVGNERININSETSWTAVRESKQYVSETFNQATRRIFIH